MQVERAFYGGLSTAPRDMPVRMRQVGCQGVCLRAWDSTQMAFLATSI